MHRPFWTTVHYRRSTCHTCSTDGRSSETSPSFRSLGPLILFPATNALDRRPNSYPRTRHPTNVQLYWPHIYASHPLVRAALPEARGPRSPPQGVRDVLRPPGRERRDQRQEEGGQP